MNEEKKACMLEEEKLDKEQKTRQLADDALDIVNGGGAGGGSGASMSN